MAIAITVVAVRPAAGLGEREVARESLPGHDERDAGALDPQVRADRQVEHDRGAIELEAAVDRSAGVDRDVKVPLNWTGRSPGTTKVTVPPTRPASPPAVITKTASPFGERVTPAVAVPSERVSADAISTVVLGATVPAGAPGATGPRTCEKTKTPLRVWSRSPVSPGVASVPTCTRTELGGEDDAPRRCARWSRC